MSIQKQRYEFLDNYKGLGIMLIMVHHVFQYFPSVNGISDFVKDFHIAMFYIAAGIVLAISTRKSNVKQFIGSRISRLIVPYIVFSIIGAVLKTLVLFIKGQLTALVVHEEIWQIMTVGNGPIWFLYRLFIIEVLYVLINKISKEKVKYLQISICLIMFISILLLKNTEGYIAATIRSVFVGYIFLSVGLLIGANMEQLLKMKTPHILIGGGTALIIGSLISIHYGVALTGKSGAFEGNLFIDFVSAILISVGLLLLCKTLESLKNRMTRFLNYYGQNSLIVLCIHPTLLLFFTYPFSSKITEWSTTNQTLIALLVLITLIALEIPFIYVINRYLQFLIGNKKRL